MHTFNIHSSFLADSAMIVENITRRAERWISARRKLREVHNVSVGIRLPAGFRKSERIYVEVLGIRRENLDLYKKNSACGKLAQRCLPDIHWQKL